MKKLAIIDIGLGDDIEGGFELCRDLRSRAPELPIIFLTARDSEFDVISGLRLGADDYLTKDISQPQMLLTLNMDRMSAEWSEKVVDLTVTELWIVHALALHPGHVKNRQQLMDAANVILDDNTITSHIKRIRKKFKEVDKSFECIQTAYGMGYRWVLES